VLGAPSISRSASAAPNSRAARRPSVPLPLSMYCHQACDHLERVSGLPSLAQIPLEGQALRQLCAAPPLGTLIQRYWAKVREKQSDAS